MGKKSKFDKLDAWIKAEYDKETKEIEDNLSDDGSFDPSRVDSDALFERIQAQIKEREENEKKKDVPGVRNGKVKINGYQVRKWVALFFVSVIGIFLASMTSEANRSYFMYRMSYLIGNEMVLDTGNEGDMKDVANWQKGKYNMLEAKEKLGIPIPTFYHMLELYTDDVYNIQCGDAIATVEYQYGDTILNLRMINRNKADLSGIEFQGKVIKELNIKRGMITMSVLEVGEPGDEKTTLAAQWEYEEGYYQLSGKIEESKFLKILKSIVY